MRHALILLLLLADLAQAQVAPTAGRYHHVAMTTWYAVLGQQAPTAMLAAQVHQESHWRPDVSSPYAHGLTQFTMATAQALADQYPELRPSMPFNARWALMAQSYLMRDLNRQLKTWPKALAGYNSGPKWVRRSESMCAEAACCVPDLWFGHTADHQWPTHRDSAYEENRNYVDRIINQLQERYSNAGWGAITEQG